jgi:hypothetical protein
MADAALLHRYFPAFDSDILEYISSLADDESIEEDERYELILEYISSFDLSDTIDVSYIVKSYLHLHRTRKDEDHEARISACADLDPLAVCLKEIEAPKVKTILELPTDEDKLKRELLRRYDDEANYFMKPSDQDATDSQESIMGLGPNENKLRVQKEREDARIRARQEQDEARAQKVAMKLKSQGDSLKSRTVARKK